MNRLYTSFILFLSVILLLIFHFKEFTYFGNTDLTTSGLYHQDILLNQPLTHNKTQLKKLSGKMIKENSQALVYRFAKPQHARFVIYPKLVKQAQLLNGDYKSTHYRTYNTVKLRSVHGKATEKTLFSVQEQINQRIDLSELLKNTSSFELVLDSSTQASEKVIGSIEFFIVNDQLLKTVPDLPLLILLWIAPVIWAWFCHHVLGFRLASSLGLAISGSFLFSLLELFKAELSQTLVLVSLLSCLGALAIKFSWEKASFSSAPFFWFLIWLGIDLRWQEILVQATVPPEYLTQVQTYYQHALNMDLFSSKGFFSALYMQGPLYPFLIKLTGFVFGFSQVHMFYLSVLMSLLLLVLAYRLANQILQQKFLSLCVLLLLVLNSQLIYESGQRSPDLLSACLGLVFLLLTFHGLKLSITRGILRGGLLVLIVWSHLSFFPLAIVLVCLDSLYQVKRSQATQSKRQAIASALVSFLIILSGAFPCLLKNHQAYGSFLPETTTYVSRVANIEFSDRIGFPASLDVLYQSEHAKRYRHLSIREYFLDYHQQSELLSASALGFLVLALDSLGSLFNLAMGKNILDAFIQGLASQQNLIHIWFILVLEVLSLLFLSVFAWKKLRRYRYLLLLVSLLLMPHAFFYGVFLLKGHTLMHGALDQQSFLVILPILAMMLIDAIYWLCQNRKRWLR